VLTYLLVGINIVVSLIAFSMMNTGRGRMFFFSPSEVAAGKNYAGMILAHFSHGDGAHLLFNMVTLFSFGPVVEDGLGPVGMLAVYVIAGIFSTVVIYSRHRAEPAYRAIGASDSISGILFAAIVVLPSMSVRFFMIPYDIPAPLFAVGYIALSTYFMRRGGGNVSHEAHLAGAFAGLILGGLLAPNGFGPLLRNLQGFLT
jgi:membrane associated rhomboid family serine protease